MRLNKYIALCGVASRRGADSLIADGRVSVNGEPVKTMGPEIEAGRDVVSVDGKVVTPPEDRVYIMLNKPAGYICSCNDERGRKTVLDIIEGFDLRLFPVGRLDADTEGLLLLTNDGDFAYQCTHPKHEVKKTYYAVIEGNPDEGSFERLRTGIKIDEVMTSPAEIEIFKSISNETSLNITIHEGRNRQVKKMFEAAGCRVTYLKRVSIGSLKLGNLRTGEWRYLKSEDFRLLGIKKEDF